MSLERRSGVPPRVLRLPVRLGHRAVARLSLVEQHEIVEGGHKGVTAAIDNSSWIEAARLVGADDGAQRAAGFLRRGKASRTRACG